MRPALILFFLQTASLLYSKGDYEGAVANIRGAANMAHVELPPTPFETPGSIAFDNAMRKFYAHNIDTVTKGIEKTLSEYNASHSGITFADGTKDAPVSKKPGRPAKKSEQGEDDWFDQKMSVTI